MLPRLLELAAGQTARLINVSEIAGPFGVSRTTVRDYLTLLRHVFLVEELPAWHANRLKRLVKTPKLHITDTGLACDRRGLERLRDAVGDGFRCGALLYDGETLVPLGDRIYAIPLGMLWGD